MYLSRIQLTEAIAQDSQLGKLLQRNSYSIHSLLWDLFETGDHFLFREESSKEQLNLDKNKPLYYVLSAREPKNQSPLFSLQTKKYSPQLKEGDSLSFKLRANPIITRRREDRKNSQKHDVVMDAQKQFLTMACVERELSIEGKKRDLKNALLNHTDYKNAGVRLQKELDDAINKAAVKWLSDRAEKNGFDLHSVQATGYRWNALPEKRVKKDDKAGFSSLDFEGVLSVTEVAPFLAMLQNGLGPAKAFGCGLMLIRRI